MSRHSLSTNHHSSGAHKILKLETTQISINKRQTGVYPYFITAKNEPKESAVQQPDESLNMALREERRNTNVCYTISFL